MTEHQESNVVELLREHLGVRYRSSIDHGREEMARVISSNMNVGRDEANAMVDELIESGQVRYVVGAEEDIEYDPEAQRDERYDPANRRDDDPFVPDRDEVARADAVAGGGGPQTPGSGLMAGAAAPVVAGGTTTPVGVPVVPVAAAAAMSDDPHAGYWDFGSGAAGVVPSQSRKGQVEPRGT